MRHEASRPVARGAINVVASLLGALLACGDGPTPVPQPDTREGTLYMVSGDNQAAEVGSLLPEPLVVMLRDSLGTPLRRAVVSFSGDGVTAEATTDATGRAELRWRLPGIAGLRRVTVVAELRSRPSVEFHVIGMAGPTTQLVRLSGESDVGFVSTDLDTIVVRPRDGFGNTTSPSIDWSVTKGGGSLRALGPDRSLAQRAIWTLGSQPGENTLTVSAGDVRHVFSAIAITDAFAPRLIAVGGGHTCALSTADVAYCWGENSLGQLGAALGSELARSPVKVNTDALFSSLVAGGLHTCGLTTAGEVYCWGFNNSGQLGSLTQRPPPMRIGGVPPFMELTAGSLHTCGLTRAGIVMCWGDNTFGQIGDGSDRSAAASSGSLASPAPVQIAGDRRFVALAAAFSTTCAIATTGETYCWGDNQDRQLGSETTTRCRIRGDPYDNPGDYDAPCSTTPVRLNIPVRLTSLTAYAHDWCGISTDSELWCWGAGLTTPRVAAPGRFAKAWLVSHIVCAVESVNGGLSCWGPWYRPGVVTTPPFGDGMQLVDLSSTGSHACGLSRDARREAYCWGSNDRGQVGDGTTTYRPAPARVLAPTNR